MKSSRMPWRSGIECELRCRGATWRSRISVQIAQRAPRSTLGGAGLPCHSSLWTFSSPIWSEKGAGVTRSARAGGSNQVTWEMTGLPASWDLGLKIQLELRSSEWCAVERLDCWSFSAQCLMFGPGCRVSRRCVNQFEVKRPDLVQVTYGAEKDAYWNKQRYCGRVKRGRNVWEVRQVRAWSGKINCRLRPFVSSMGICWPNPS